jgi:tetratricopeptide (TPR) repeat protein
VQTSRDYYSENTDDSGIASVLTLEQLLLPPPPAMEAVNWPEVWSLLSEPRQLGLGEGLATEVWLEKDFHAENQPAHPVEGESPARLHWEAAQQKLRTWTAGGSQEVYPSLRFDSRRPDLFSLVRQACRQARQALIDPYTELLCEIGEVDPHFLEGERNRAGRYAFSSGANLKLGQGQLAEGNFRGAEAAFRRALKADRHDPESWWHLGLVGLFRRKSRSAQKAFQQALDHRPNEIRSQLGLGLAYYHDRRYAKAEECFSRAKGPDRRGTGARSFLACCYRLQRKFPQALGEIHHLETCEIPAWREMGKQCRRCVARGEGAAQDKSWRWWAALGPIAFILLGAGEEIYRKLEALPGKHWHWFEKGLSLAFVLMLLALARREIVGSLKQKLQEREGGFGEGKESLPCWQTRAWMRPHKLDLFGHALPIARK